MGQGLEILHVPGRADQNEIRFAGDIIALLDLRFGPGAFAEHIELLQRFPFQFDMHDKSHPVFKAGRVEHRDFFQDQLGVAQPLQPPLNRGNGKTAFLGQMFKTDTTIGLKRSQNGEICLV